MNNLNELVKQYKKNKSSKILNEIFLIVDKQLQQKAKWIFYQQNFNIEGKICKLNDVHKVDIDDIVQELRLTVLELIEKYNPKKPFENYLNHTLTHWFPEIMRKKDTRRDLGLVSQGELYNEETEEGINIENFPIPEQTSQEKPDIDEMFVNLTEREKKLLELMIEFPEKNQQELADIIGVTQQRIDQILKGLRKKYKKTL